MRQVQIEEAGEHFAELLSQAEAGESLTILRGNRAVAQIVPFRAQVDIASHDAARQRLRAAMDRGLDLGGVWNGRDELYERD